MDLSSGLNQLMAITRSWNKRPCHHSLCSRMLARWFFPVFALLFSATCNAQLCTSTHTSDLYCLIPTAFHVPATPFQALFTPFGTELSQLPTPKPAGLVLHFEHGLLVPDAESFGAVFIERPETLGRHRVFVGFAYQNFTMSAIDGIKLGSFPVVLFYPYGGGVYTVTQNRLEIRAGQYTAIASAGVSNRVDLTISVPFSRIAMASTVNGTEYGPGNATASFNQYLPGRAGGISDVVVGTKVQFLDRKNIRVAAGVDVRLPTGDELNFLGSGTLGLRPYIAIARHGRLSPHANVGYQWNGNSILNATDSGAKQRLPTSFFYAAGVNVLGGKRWVVMADLLGRQFFDAPRLSSPTQRTYPAPIGPALSVQPNPHADYNATDLSLGFKVQTVKKLVLTGNVTIPLNDGGLRAKAVPLVGLAYTF